MANFLIGCSDLILKPKNLVSLIQILAPMKNSQTHRVQFILPGREDQYKLEWNDDRGLYP